MIEKLIPPSVRAQLRKQVEALFDKRLSEANSLSLPTALIKYQRFCNGQSHYVLPQRYIVAPTSGTPLIPPSHLWGGYWRDSRSYLESGQLQADAMLKALRLSSTPVDGSLRILDYGCGAGRMIRHLENVAERGEVWGVDINAEAIHWCKQHLPAAFRFATTTTLPHLPFEDRYFDVIYARSVFTHIDDLADSWLLELRRIIRPGGRLYATIHDERTIELFSDPQFADHPYAKAMRTDIRLQAIQNGAGMLAIGRDVDSQIFYHRAYFCDMARLAGLETLSVLSDGYGYQTAILFARV